MWKDPIIEEIHKFREEYARQFNFDINAICKDIREKQSNSEHKIVSFPPRRPETKHMLPSRENYTEERAALFDHLTMDDILSEVKKMEAGESHA